MQTKSKIKVNLRKIREEKGMTQFEVSEKARFSKVQKPVSAEYSCIERGVRIPRVDKAIRIARALGVKVEDVWHI